MDPGATHVLCILPANVVSGPPHVRSRLAAPAGPREGDRAAGWPLPTAAPGQSLSRGGFFLLRRHLIKLLLPSFVCSVELAETEQANADEFSQFVKVGVVSRTCGLCDSVQHYEHAPPLKASKHPPNELSVPRCYSPGKTPPPSSRAPPSPSSSLTGSSPRSLCSRPRLRRERAQDIEDGDHYSLTRYFYSSD